MEIVIEFQPLNKNENIRLESAMDEFRALALWMVNNEKNGYLFELIKKHSLQFAVDIYEQGRVNDKSVDLLFAQMSSVKRAFGIGYQDVQTAKQKQLFIGAGFWEMRRFIGQMSDAVQLIYEKKPTHIVCAGLSGCVLGEYLGVGLQREYGYELLVDHMIFERDGKLPIGGQLKEGFELVGKNILIVEDAVDEARTLGIMTRVLSGLRGDLTYHLFSLQIENNNQVQQVLEGMESVICFSE
ncbi:hypothetical protein A2382_04100 [Candidatus Woesebacteria bacterium RIFOXYB1_FULL_38_16]|uniref:Phosphoribosyltransferase domain-containing protein n=1 Tax=Candidatus Woesebacteria bacterium RIFOXYB1_FULL_38_16 TaxID=1802538 RepID=A0A1F8CR34_9BACT|nr:MAG: hypothetical protein A2191_05095 [Candidatus Woesebacteria bacterium RIFOXYA1_FULL_38_9]OGM78721.1 MAG: hypothetical protein A2382_04100 [Candidatus Woesebacteria bacterium RIFOXYB1_FULL_38_16]